MTPPVTFLLAVVVGTAILADASAPSVVLRDKYRTWISDDEALFRPNKASAAALPSYAKVISPPSLTSFAMVEATSGVLTMFGGEMTSAEVAYEPLAKGVSNAVYQFDVESNKWYNESVFTISPAARIDHAAWVWNNKMYIYGGANETVMTDVWSYSNRSWHRLPFTFPDRKGHTASVVDTNNNATTVYIFGGLDNSDGYHDDMFILHADGTITNMTSSTGTKPSRRAYHAAAVMQTMYEGSLIFIHGGTDGNEIFSDLYVYYTINNTWSFLSSGSSPSAKGYDSSYIPALETDSAMKHDCVAEFPILFCVGGRASGYPISMIFDIKLGRWVRAYYTDDEKLLPLQNHRLVLYKTPLGVSEVITVGGVTGRPAHFINQKGFTMMKTDMFPEECPYEYVNGDWEGRCFLCLGGYGADRSFDPHRCFTCPSGTYSGKGRCLDCPAATYNPISGASNVSQCLNCPAGYFTVDTGANRSSLCVTCPIGTYALKGTCIGCPAGTYGTTAGAVFVDVGCTPCPFGQYSRVGATSCTSCPPGSSGGPYVQTYDPVGLYVRNFVQATNPGGCSSAVRNAITNPVDGGAPFYITIAVRDHGTDGTSFTNAYAPLDLGTWQSGLRVHMDFYGDAAKVHYGCQSSLPEPTDCASFIVNNQTTPEMGRSTFGQGQNYVCDGNRIYTFMLRIADAGLTYLRFYSHGIRTVTIPIITTVTPAIKITKMNQTLFLAGHVYTPAIKILAWTPGNIKQFMNYTGTTGYSITTRCTTGTALFRVNGGAARLTQSISFTQGIWMPSITFTTSASGCTLLGIDQYNRQVAPDDTTPFDVQLLVGLSIEPLNNVSQHGILRAEIRGITDQNTVATADNFTEYLVILNKAVQMANRHKVFISEPRVTATAVSGIAIAQMHIYSSAAILNFSTFGFLDGQAISGPLAPVTNTSLLPFYVRPVNGTRLRIVEYTYKFPTRVFANSSFPVEVEIISNQGVQDSSRDFDITLGITGCSAKLMIVNVSHWGPLSFRLKSGHSVLQLFVQGQDTTNCVISIKEKSPNKHGTIGTYSTPFDVISPKRLTHDWTCASVQAGPIYLVNLTLRSNTGQVITEDGFGVLMEPAGNSSAAVEYYGHTSQRLVNGKAMFSIQYKPSIVPVRIAFWAGTFKTVPVYNYTYQYYPFYQRFATFAGYQEIFVKIAYIQTALMCPQVPILKATRIRVISRVPKWIEHNQLLAVEVEAVDVFGVRDPSFNSQYSIRIKGCGGSINDEMAWTWSTDATGYSELSVIPGAYGYRMLSTDSFTSTRGKFAFGYAKMYFRPTFTTDTNTVIGVQGCEIHVIATTVTAGFAQGFDVRHTYPACRVCDAGTFSFGDNGRNPAYTVFHPGGCMPCMVGTFSAATGAVDDTSCEVCLGNYGWNTNNYRNDLAAEGKIRCSYLCPYGSSGRVGGGSCINPVKWTATSPTIYAYRGRTHIACGDSACVTRPYCPAGQFRIDCTATPVLNSQSACLWEGLGGTCSWNATTNQCQGPTFTCFPCISGYGREYATQTDGNQTCLPCQAGGWQTEANGRTQIDTNTYAYTFQRYYCPGGTYGGSTFSNTCTGVDRHECWNGTYSATTAALTNDTCLTCPSGHYCHQVKRYRVNCNNIGSCITGITSNMMCPLNAGCYACPLSAYVMNGLFAPIPCPSGTYNNFTGRTDPSDCLTCPAGTYCPIGSSYPLITDTLGTSSNLAGNLTPSAVSFYGSDDVISCANPATSHGSGYVQDGHFSEYATYIGRNGGSNYVQESGFVSKWSGSFYYFAADISGSTATSLSARTNSSIGVATQRVELLHELPIDMVLRVYVQYNLDNTNLSGVVPPSQYITPFVGLEVTVTYVDAPTGFSNDSDYMVKPFPTPAVLPDTTWHLLELDINPTRPIRYVTINLASRGFYQGYVLFDDVSLRPADGIICNCSTGFYFNASNNGSECQRCKPGYACSGGTIVRCVNSWSTSAMPGCQYCRDGWLCDSDGRGRLIACQLYTYKDNATEQCFPCPNGYSCRDGIKYMCHNGFYGAGGLECIECQPGYYSPEGSPQNQCIKCPPGTTSQGARPSCFQCPINHYSPNGTGCYSAPEKYFVPAIGSTGPKSCVDLAMDNYTVSIPRNRHGFVIRVVPYVCELYYSYQVTRYEDVTNGYLGSVRISSTNPAVLYDAGPHNYPDWVHVFKVYFTSNVNALEQYSTVTVNLTNTPIQGVDDDIIVPHPQKVTTYRITTFPANDINNEHDWVWIQSVTAPVALNTTPMTAGVPRVSQWDMTQQAGSFVGVDYESLHPALFVTLPAGFRGPMHIRPITFDQYCAVPNSDCLETNPHSLIKITAKTRPPVAVDDYFRVQIGRVEPLDVLANDYDPENDVITITGTTASTRSNYIPPIQNLCPTNGITGCLNPVACSTANLYGGSGTAPNQCMCFYANLEDRCRTYYPDDQSLTFVDFTGSTGVCGLESFTYTIASNDGTATATAVVENYQCYCQGSQYTNNAGFDMIFLLDGTTSETDFDFQLSFASAIYQRSEEATKFRVGIIEVGTNRAIWNLSTTFPSLDLLGRAPYGDETTYTLGYAFNLTQTMLNNYPLAGVRPTWVVVVSGHDSVDSTDNVRKQVPGARLMTFAVAADGKNYQHFEDDFKGAYVSKVQTTYEGLASDQTSEQDAMDTMCSN